MSTCRRNARRPLVLIACALTLGLATASVSQAAGPTASPAAAARPGALSTFLGDAPALPDVDTRRVLAPSAAVRAAAAAVSPGAHVSWNAFGTPASVTPRAGGFLATGLSANAVTAARAFLTAHRAAFGLSAAEVRSLELVNDAHLIGSTGHAVLLRQVWGGAHAVEGGLVAVGVVGGKVASVTSTLAPGLTLNTRTASVTAAQAVLTAARDAGFRSLTAADLSVTPGQDSAGFTQVAAKGLAQPQRVRLAVLPTPAGSRLVWETDVLDVQDGRALATMTFVDAVSGAVLVRRDAVDTLAAGAGVPRAAAVTSAGMLAAPSAPATFAADFTDKACGKGVALTVPTGTRSINLAGTADQPENDVVFQVSRNGAVVGSSDTGGGQEVLQLTLATPATATDVFTVEVCPSPAPLGPLVAPFTAHGGYSTDNASGSGGTTTQQVGVPYAPSWQYFQDSPNLTAGPDAAKDVRTTACWTTDQKDPAVNKDLSGCQEDVGSAASGQPWDVDARTGLPTFTTTGNNAFTADARLGSTLTPGATAYQPRSATRDYGSAFTDQWNTSGCDPTTLRPLGADQDAAITNLFTGHNIMHDFAYRLGFTERGYNMQVSNKGLTGPTQENDPEVGNVHSGALTNEAVVAASTASGVAAPVTGRDNANQITLQDGTPGITNQYMFQPLLGFYGPCADGDLDFSIFGHEYTHAISNRMVAGPDTGLSGAQAGSMGESWSDLDALEAMHELGIAGARGENPDSVGAYATHNSDRGIRDFALNANPLGYADFGFDATGPEVHADGEIWNGVQWHVRDALIAAHAADAPATDTALQRACATGRTPAGSLSSPASGFAGCPGNRHWIQYVYDSFLLQASGSPTFFDMSNLMMSAATLRGSETDRAVMATALAQRGLGTDTTVNGTGDTDPKAGYASEVARDNGTVSFAVTDADTRAPVVGEVYLGVFQARVTPFVRTAATPVPPRTVAAGTYDVLVRADGYGLQRRVLTVTAGKDQTMKIALDRNLASKRSGASITGDGVRLDNLIDDSEATNGGFDGSAAKTPIAGRQFTVDLGGLKEVARVSVSSLHHPADATVPGDIQGRLLGVRGFHLQTSNDGGKTYTTVYTTKDFFPAVAPRPVAPDLVLRDAVLTSPVRADHLRLVVDSNQCTGAPAYQGDQDSDPLNNADCAPSANANKVTVTELEAFGPSAAGFLGGQPATGLAGTVAAKK